MAATASDHATAPPRNGNSPPWGNSTAAMPTGAAASTASTASRCRLSCSHHAVRARASATPATGLAGAVAIARTAARTVLSRRAAASAAIATASPRANVSRPIATLTMVPAANSRLAGSDIGRRGPGRGSTRQPGRSWRWRRPALRPVRRASGTARRTPGCGDRRTTGCSRSPDRTSRSARPAAAVPASRHRASRGRLQRRRARPPKQRA